MKLHEYTRKGITSNCAFLAYYIEAEYLDMSQHIIVKAWKGLYADDNHSIKIMGDSTMMVCYTTAERQNERKPPLCGGTQGYHLNWRLSPCFIPVLPNWDEMTLNWCWPLIRIFNFCLTLNWIYPIRMINANPGSIGFLCSFHYWLLGILISMAQ